MADLRSLSETKADILDIKIGADDAWYHAQIDLTVDYTQESIVPASIGESIGELVTGRVVEGTITFMQVSAAMLRRLLDLAATPWHALAIGSRRTTESLTIHDPQDGVTTTADLFVYACMFRNLRRTNDGQGLAQVQVDFRGIRDANGKVWRIGQTA